MTTKFIIFVAIFSLIFQAHSAGVYAQSEAGTSAQLRSRFVLSRVTDPRPYQLRIYLESHNSPLAVHADDFVRIADAHGLDWTLLPAIAGVESTFAKRYPQGSYNPFGWGIYGNQVLRFRSFTEAMEVVATGLTTRYPDGALNDIYLLGRIYNGVTPGSWSGKILFFMSKIKSHTPNISSISPTI